MTYEEKKDLEERLIIAEGRLLEEVRRNEYWRDRYNALIIELRGQIQILKDAQAELWGFGTDAAEDWSDE